MHGRTVSVVVIHCTQTREALSSMLSCTKGPDAPLIESSIAEVFQKTAARVPANDAIVVCHQKARFSFAQLQQEVERAARGLTKLGLGAQDRIGVWSTNCVE